MDQELIDEVTFRKIVNNQAAILTELEQADGCLQAFIELSNKHYGQAEETFKEATNTIQRIRSNFDAIYKNIRLLKAKRKELEEKKQLAKKSNEVEIQFTFSPKSSTKEEIDAERPSEEPLDITVMEQPNREDREKNGEKSKSEEPQVCPQVVSLGAVKPERTAEQKQPDQESPAANT